LSQLELVVPDEVLAGALEAISKGAWTGTLGDAKIFVTEVPRSDPHPDR